GAATDPRYLMNVCDLSGYVAPRLDEAGPVRQAGTIRPPQEAGLGVSPNPNVLGEPAAVIE
ncbi:MAG: mandelate racemase, partial [Nitratireductor sp.]|nr:mandelate racemase [Nitratireductor sp.]